MPWRGRTPAAQMQAIRSIIEDAPPSGSHYDASSSGKGAAHSGKGPRLARARARAPSQPTGTRALAAQKRNKKAEILCASLRLHLLSQERKLSIMSAQERDGFYGQVQPRRRADLISLDTGARKHQRWSGGHRPSPVTAPKPATVEAAPRTCCIKVKTPPIAGQGSRHWQILRLRSSRTKLSSWSRRRPKCREAGLEELPDIQSSLQAVRQAIQEQKPDGRRLDQTAQKLKRATAAKVKQQDHIKDLHRPVTTGTRTNWHSLVTQEKEAMDEHDKAKAAVVQSADLTAAQPALDSAAAGITTALSAALRTATAAGKEASEAEVAFFIRQHLAALTANILKPPPPCRWQRCSAASATTTSQGARRDCCQIAGRSPQIQCSPPPDTGARSVTAARLTGGAPDPDAAGMEGVEAAPIKRPHCKRLPHKRRLPSHLAKMGRGGRPPARETAATEVDGTDTRGRSRSPTSGRTQCRERTNPDLRTCTGHVQVMQTSSSASARHPVDSVATHDCTKACECGQPHSSATVSSAPLAVAGDQQGRSDPQLAHARA